MMAGFYANAINRKPGEAMYGVKDPDEMTPEERMRELVVILARGYLRLRGNSPFRGDSTAKSDGGNAATSDISNGCDLDKSTS